MEAIKTIKGGKFTLNMYHDNNENFFDTYSGFSMVCFHSRYYLGNVRDYKIDDFDSFSKLKKTIIKREKPAVILPLYMFQHSGIALSTIPFNEHWDSGQIGFIYLTRQDLMGSYGRKNLSKKLRIKTESFLNSIIETYEQYINGDVYYYEIVDNTTDELMDSCGGFYGNDIKENGMFEYIKDEFKEDLKLN